MRLALEEMLESNFVQADLGGVPTISVDDGLFGRSGSVEIAKPGHAAEYSRRHHPLLQARRSLWRGIEIGVHESPFSVG